ncbi:MAG: hypothetical protein K0S28_1824 [Paucimonas sp.]|jgi:hypothetical protein|nr:hypothetical protein [Paucimonas sp.]
MKIRTLHPLSCVFLALSALLPASSFAQQPAPSDAPPRMETLDETNEPGVTIRQREPQTTVTEKKKNGQVTDIKVKSGKSTYHIKPGQAGNVVPGDAQSRQTNPPQWVVKEFGPNSKPATPTNPPEVLAPPEKPDTGSDKK